MRIISSYGSLEKDCWIIGRQAAEALFWFLLLWLLTGTARAADIDKLVTVLIAVESGGDCNAIGDNKQAVGCLQLHPCYVQDVNRISGRHFTLADRYNRSKSIEMTRIYLAHYGGAYEKKTGRPATLDVLAALHNAGPKGYLKMNKPGVKKYIAKIKKELTKQKSASQDCRQKSF